MKEGKRIFCIEPGTANGAPVSAEWIRRPRKKAIVVITGRTISPTMGARPMSPATEATPTTDGTTPSTAQVSTVSASDELPNQRPPATAASGRAAVRIPAPVSTTAALGTAMKIAPAKAPRAKSRTVLTLFRRGESRLARR